MNRTELLQKINLQAGIVWGIYRRIYPELQNFKMPEIRLNYRFTKTAGNCEVERNIINLGGKFYQKHYNRMMREILPHEMAHQIDYNLNGLPKRWHGKSWQDIMLKYGLQPLTYHDMEI